jgi:hypothetical protein
MNRSPMQQFRRQAYTVISYRAFCQTTNHPRKVKDKVESEEKGKIKTKTKRKTEQNKQSRASQWTPMALKRLFSFDS